LEDPGISTPNGDHGAGKGAATDPRG